jgi:RHS repeat-associated protein
MPSPCVPENRVRDLRVVRTPRIGARRRINARTRWENRRVYDGVASGRRYPGQYYDAETGLNQNAFRDYDPKTGRYPEADPIGLAGGINVFTYSFDNPISSFDPNGLRRIRINDIDDPFEKAAWDFPGYLVISGHGSLDAIGNHRRPGDPLRISYAVDDVVENLVNNWGYDGTEPIVLDSCHSGEKTGSGGKSFAERVVDTLWKKYKYAATIWGYDGTIDLVPVLNIEYPKFYPSSNGHNGWKKFGDWPKLISK